MTRSARWLGGAPLAGLAGEIAAAVAVPLVDGVAAAARQAETLAALRPRKATAGSFRHPAAKPMIGLPASLVRRITQGSRLYRDFVAPRDALPVARLRQAGAVVIGIGNMPEFGAKEITDNAVYGRTLNPRDLSRTPGGSSGGCAAALASDMAPIAIGGDGGSCRRPPAHVGVVGFKPSPGIVADPFGFPGTLPGIACTCPMGRVVADVAAAFEVMAGPHAEDVLSVACPDASTGSVPVLRFAYSPLLGLDLALDEDVRETVDAAVTTLRKAGLQIGDADPIWPDGTEETRIMAIEDSGLAHLFGLHFRSDPACFDPAIGVQIERGLRASAADVAAAHGFSLSIGAAIARFFNRFDFLICPTTACVAWPADLLDPKTVGGRPARRRDHAAFTPLFNHARTPAISLPCGTGTAGLPVGLQLVGRRGADRDVLRAAAWIETALSGQLGTVFA